MISYHLTVNGIDYPGTADQGRNLLSVIRTEIGLTGTKEGCDDCECGACMVHLDGKSVFSCLLPIKDLNGRSVTTIEGLSKHSDHAVQKAWAAVDVPQCGYCQSGQIMAAAALLKRYPKPTDAQIDEVMTNICRCGTYQRIREAIHSAVRASSKAASSELKSGGVQ